MFIETSFTLKRNLIEDAMRINSVFGAYLCLQELDNINNDVFQNICVEYSQANEGRFISNKGGWQSTDLVGNKQFAPLAEIITEVVSLLKEPYKIKESANFYISEMWLNINKPTNYNILHHHGDSFLSGVYYVSVPPDAGKLWFRHPSVAKTVINWNEYFDGLNEHNSNSWYVEPKAGDLIIFPSWLEHEVDQNNSNEERISIAFNLKLMRAK